MIIQKTQEDWDQWFLGLADYVGTASKDPSTKVGSIIVGDKNRIISLGYNGIPHGVPDNSFILQDRNIKYKMVLHAEQNALLWANEKLEGASLYVTLFPCYECAKAIIQKGIRRVVSYATTPEQETKYYEDFWRFSRQLFNSAGVEIQTYAQKID